MARRFCTLEEAVTRLSTTVEELESMLAEGILEEYRDGTGRFLRAADIQRLAFRKKRAGAATATMSPPEANPWDVPTDEDILAWRQERPRHETGVAQVSNSDLDLPSARTSRRPKRPGLRSWRTSKRRGLWAGVLEDRPTAILAVFTLAALFVGGLAAGAYFLLHKL